MQEVELVGGRVVRNDDEPLGSCDGDGDDVDVDVGKRMKFVRVAM